eukprot:8231532-Pyramimonas_sp.AAC.1
MLDIPLGGLDTEKLLDLALGNHVRYTPRWPGHIKTLWAAMLDTSWWPGHVKTRGASSEQP